MSTNNDKSDKNPNGKPPPSRALLKWLKQQAAKLKKLVRRGWKLQADYLENAREQGAVLVEVRLRLEDTDLSFADWVREEADIGVSTAYLWCEVAEWWDDPFLQELLKNSNPLELTLRQVRDAIRDARQAQGGGKPGSGRRTANGTTTSSAPEAEEGAAADSVADGEDAEGTTTTGDSNAAEKKYEKLMSRFKGGGDMHNGGGTMKPTQPALYKVTVMTSTKADLERFGALLPSPIIDFNAHSVWSWVSLKDIKKTMAVLGEALDTARPKKVRIVVEL